MGGFVLGNDVDIGRLAAVVTSYNPDPTELTRTLDSLAPQVDKVWLIDDGSTMPPDCSTFPTNVDYVRQPRNQGLAHAQNLGFQLARAAGYSLVLLSDQDTEYPPDYSSQMLAAWTLLAKQGLLIAALSPDYRNLNDAAQRSWLARRYHARPEQAPIEVDWAIASGKLIDLKALDQVGPMREDLFIDWVDYEWCQRAQQVGRRIYAHPGICIQHRLGRAGRSLGWRFLHYSPMRNYYYLRNALWLLKTPRPARQRSKILALALRRLLQTWLVQTPRGAQWRASLKALRDGWRG